MDKLKEWIDVFVEGVAFTSWLMVDLTLKSTIYPLTDGIDYIKKYISHKYTIYKGKKAMKRIEHKELDTNA